MRPLRSSGRPVRVSARQVAWEFLATAAVYAAIRVVFTVGSVFRYVALAALVAGLLASRRRSTVAPGPRRLPRGVVRHLRAGLVLPAFAAIVLLGADLTKRFDAPWVDPMGYGIAFAILLLWLDAADERRARRRGRRSHGVPAVARGSQLMAVDR